MPLAESTRSREIAGPKVSAITDFYIANGNVVSHSEKVLKANGRQTTVSEGHQWPPPKGSLVDRGGPFYTSKRYVLLGNSRESITSSPGRGGPPDYGQKIVTKGNFLAVEPGGLLAPWPADPSSSDDDLVELGATAIARCEPTNSPANAATFLAELLKDGLPSLVGKELWQSRTKDALKASSGEYLNLQFGVQPFVSDISKFLSAVKHADVVLDQYERDAGKVVRRHYGFPSEVNTSEFVEPSLQSVWGLDTGYGVSSGVLTRRVETRREAWFSGAFTYHLPRGYDSRSAMHRCRLLAEQVLGAKVTPEVLWNVAPWSWAVDWFSNTGDVISNLTKFGTGGLVMPYGYMMEKSITKHTYTLDKPTGYSGELLDAASVTLVVETKKRIRANPFGFGVHWDGLSPFQISILAALGLNKRGR